VALVAPGLRDDKPEVGVDHAFLGLEVTSLDPLGQLNLLGRGEQRVDAGPTQEELKRLGSADRALELGCLQTIAGMGGTPPVLPTIALRRMGPEDPLGLVWVDFVIATDARGAVAMGVMTLQFLSPLCRQGSMHVEL
jgi:hypothetical protein